jgi:FdhD protein
LADTFATDGGPAEADPPIAARKLRPPGESVEITEVVEWSGGEVRRVVDYLAAEEPLQISVNGAPLSVAMRTPGHDLELAAGFLLTEGIIDSVDHLIELRSRLDESTGKSNLVEVEVAPAHYDPDLAQRNFLASSSCGVCGKTSIDSVRRRGLGTPNPVFRVSPEVLCSLAGKLRGEQTVFEKTGGLHAAALFNAAGDLIQLREDIGRHNAVDKIVGWALLERRLPLSGNILMVSGRGGFELAQKAIVAGIPVMASVSAPSSLAVKLARELGLTLVGFLRGSRFVVYSRHDRLLLA